VLSELTTLLRHDVLLSTCLYPLLGSIYAKLCKAQALQWAAHVPWTHIGVVNAQGNIAPLFEWCLQLSLCSLLPAMRSNFGLFARNSVGFMAEVDSTDLHIHPYTSVIPGSRLVCCETEHGASSV
jgi:hypothetical protein